MKALQIFGMSILVLLVCSRNAQAYLDAGSGSYVLQVILASLLGVLVAAKAYWKNIKSFFTAKILRKQSPPDDNH